MKTTSLIAFAIFFWIAVFAFYLMWPPITPTIADDTVSVTAQVGTTITCTSEPTTTDFGTLDVSTVSTSTPWATTTFTCSDGDGCTLSVYDAGDGASNPGLYSSGVPNLIGSADESYNDTATLVAGTEGYGIKGATTSAGSGEELLMQNPRYNRYDRGGYDNTSIGGLERSGSTQEIASSTGTFSSREVEVIHLAAISALTETAADYADTISYSCVGN